MLLLKGAAGLLKRPTMAAECGKRCARKPRKMALRQLRCHEALVWTRCVVLRRKQEIGTARPSNARRCHRREYTICRLTAQSGSTEHELDRLGNHRSSSVQVPASPAPPHLATRRQRRLPLPLVGWRARQPLGCCRDHGGSKFPSLKQPIKPFSQNGEYGIA
jgi:hypothetical protein